MQYVENLDTSANCSSDGAFGHIPLDDKDEIHDIPDDVLQALRGVDDGMVESDAVIAQLLQSEFDLEHDEQLKRIEKARNKDSKVTVSLRNYRMLPEELIYDSEEEEEPENRKSDWDRFETNDKKLLNLPKRGSARDEDGEMRTKHDEYLTGVRNAGRVMDFPPDFNTGDGAGFDMKLSNSVFNRLKNFSAKSNTKKTSKANDRKENVATTAMGLDQHSRMILYKLVENGILNEVNGIVSTGKEAIVLHADCDPAYVGDLILPSECAIKVFSTTLNEYKQRDRYIKDDYRFDGRFSNQNKRVVIEQWAEKEMHNLIRMKKAGITCPDVVIIKRHILVMSFIGTDSYAAPKLKDVKLTDAQWQVAYEEVIDSMMRMTKVARLIHGDLSEYNILYFNEKCYIIDVAQSVEPEHASALELLMRDCTNITRFFNSRGVQNVKTKDELFNDIMNMDPTQHSIPLLQRLHAKGALPHVLDRIENDENYPEDMKPLVYPFDYAWETVSNTKKGKKKKEITNSSTSNETVNEPVAVVN